jgi:23S rRNA (guanosine2251-2'-O)-methyltransferase
VEEKTIVTGRNPVYEYLRESRPGSGLVLYISEGAHGKIIDEIISEAGKKKARIIRKQKEYFSSHHPSSTHQGVILEITGDTVRLSQEGFLRQTAGKKGLLVLLDHLTDPHNVGSIIRSSEALGADGVVIPRSGSAGITETVIKTSAGATAYLEILQAANTAAFIDAAKEAGFWVIGTSDRGEKDISDVRPYRPALIVIGSEGEGMRRLTAEKCDFLVKIPLRGKIPSLNASVAAAIIIYEMMKE